MAFAVGDIVGGCEIVARLKAGGMATLYVARRAGVAGFSRLVAIKVVHDHLAEDEGFVQMFVNEALLQSRISHPNVVHVQELGRESDQHFLVMEYVHGCSLSQLLKELAKRDRGLPFELSVSIAMQILAGLHAAHEVRDEQGQPAGVVHRDVSPDNALLSYDGHVKLIDFGIAKVQSRATQTGNQLKGKLRYMSPEQALGAEVDRRTDVYALGVVLWEMLTMRRLFTAEDQFKLLESVRNPEIPTPSSIRPDVPPKLEAAVMKALARRPEDRFATANELRRALAEACPGALLADAAQLAELLAVAMPEQIAAAEQLLASGTTSLPPTPPASDEAALRTMTISATGLEFLGASDPSRSSTAGPPPADPATGAPPPYVPAEPITSGGEAPDRHVTIRRPVLIGVTAVAALAALVGGVVFGTVAASRLEEEPGIQATELAPRGEAPPELPAATAPEPESAEAEPAPSEPPVAPAAVEPAEPEPEVEIDEPPTPRAAPASPSRARRGRTTPRGGTSTRRLRSGGGAPLADEF